MPSRGDRSAVNVRARDRKTHPPHARARLVVALDPGELLVEQHLGPVCLGVDRDRDASRGYFVDHSAD